MVQNLWWGAGYNVVAVPLAAGILAAIGLKTSLKEVAGVGVKPMIAGVIIDISVVFVSLFAQAGILYFMK